MMMLETCWSPCFWHDSIRSGSIAVAVYTAAFSVVLITYTAYVMSGGESSQYYLPYFETDIKSSTQIVGWFVIIILICLIVFSALMVQGIRRNNRGLMIPWFVIMFLIIFFMACFGLWLIAGYYQYLWSVFAAIITFIWMGYNIYCILVVYSQYKLILELQTPNIILLY